MKMGNLFKLVIAIAISELAGIASSIFAKSSVAGWYASLEKPEITPPSWVFGPVWTMLYILIGVALFLVWKNDWKIENQVFSSRHHAWNRWSERLWTGDWQKINVILIL